MILMHSGEPFLRPAPVIQSSTRTNSGQEKYSFRMIQQGSLCHRFALSHRASWLALPPRLPVSSNDYLVAGIGQVIVIEYPTPVLLAAKASRAEVEVQKHFCPVCERLPGPETDTAHIVRDRFHRGAALLFQHPVRFVLF